MPSGTGPSATAPGASSPMRGSACPAGKWQRASSSGKRWASPYIPARRATRRAHPGRHRHGIRGSRPRRNPLCNHVQKARNLQLARIRSDNEQQLRAETPSVRGILQQAPEGDGALRGRGTDRRKQGLSDAPHLRIGQAIRHPGEPGHVPQLRGPPSWTCSPASSTRGGRSVFCPTPSAPSRRTPTGTA